LLGGRPRTEPSQCLADSGDYDEQHSGHGKRAEHEDWKLVHAMMILHCGWQGLLLEGQVESRAGGSLTEQNRAMTHSPRYGLGSIDGDTKHCEAGCRLFQTTRLEVNDACSNGNDCGAASQISC
jgi:hypothetical protein